MHEFSIMQSALQQALREARQAGAARVHEIRLRIGVLSGVVPDALHFAWCASCRREFVSANLYAECPDCRHPSGELRAGREMELSSMEVDYV
jgi:hydrogenase nickel incorporation protein HypA/HybF